MVGKKITEFFELIKPLVDFKYEVREAAAKKSLS